MIGKVINHYEVLGNLGQGGMGIVYKARDTRLGREVALKFLPKNQAFRDEHVDRFLVEAQAASALDHPNTCVVHGVEESDGEHFIVMSYYEGQTLDELISQGGMHWRRAVSIATQIASGISAAHRRGIIHRDIKPSNVIIQAGDVVKILDFGLAKLHDLKMTSTGSTMGTCAYMSPEQVQGELLDHRTDIWSFGIVLYELLTGTPPFGRAFPAVFNAILHEIPPAPASVCDEIPPFLSRIVTRCIEKDKALRYQSMEAVLAALEVVGQVEPSAADRTRIRRTPEDAPSIAGFWSGLRSSFASKPNGPVRRWLGIGGLLFLTVAGGLAFLSRDTPSSLTDQSATDASAIEEQLTNGTSVSNPVLGSTADSTTDGTGSGSASAEHASPDLTVPIKSVPALQDDASQDATTPAVPAQLTFELWTNKGTEGLNYAEGDRMTVFVQTNRPAYVRVVYRFADGTRTLLTDNVRIDAVDRPVEIGTFTCAPPFGSETLLAFAQTEPFTPVETVTVNDYQILKEDLETFAAQTRGFKQNAQQAERRLEIVTQAN
jgi:serine/threonine protein kinase